MRRIWSRKCGVGVIEEPPPMVVLWVTQNFPPSAGVRAWSPADVHAGAAPARSSPAQLRKTRRISASARTYMVVLRTSGIVGREEARAVLLADRVRNWSRINVLSFLRILV
ncbi:hypothetical protein CISG_07456 [Coccidioides immitis RMSCC 3703]|uniref:Uncharacterized protein n=1 Tax=Coccidioides immitis RMSCC 3703 TaxID=454286 RepID=A0A0J8TWV7_COCIT|nr:hypothetical protein CISG_07456 [Coccidioides immitis RMSCC 3703]